MQTNAPDAIFARLRAIQGSIAAGQLADAAAALNDLAQVAPRDPRLFLTGAALARAAGNPQQELLSLQHATRVAPKWPPAYLELAKAHSRAGRHTEAAAAVDQAVQLAPQDLPVLEIAVAVATAANQLATAQKHLEAALALRAGDPTIHRALGACLTDQGRHSEAEAQWRAVVAQAPHDLLGLGGLGTCLLSLKRKEEAAEVLQRALAIAPNHPSLLFHLAIAQGETPRAQPPEIPQALFDDYATRFDKHLVGELKYRVPKRVTEYVRSRHPELAINILDLGCGTGLLGVYLGRVNGSFIGVDVSAKMLAEAARHDIYTELRHADLMSALRQASPASFDYVTANDVFVYVGDLSEVLPAARTALRADGALVFSCEAAEEAEGELVLRPTKRYAHSRSGVRRLCAEAGFAQCVIEDIDLRFDGGDKPIPGFIAFVQCSAD